MCCIIVEVLKGGEAIFVTFEFAGSLLRNEVKWRYIFILRYIENCTF